VDKLVSERTATDVVTWADHVVLATPVAETKVWGETEMTDDGSGDGLVLRRLTIRIDETLWTRSGAESSENPFTSLEWGWVLKERELSIMGDAGAPRYEIGHQYVMSIVKDEGEWGTFGEASFPVEQGAIAPALGQGTAFARQSKGMSPTALGAELERTPPYEGVEPFLSLPFRERVEAFYSSSGG
jgi:hypothetical protein